MPERALSVTAPSRYGNPFKVRGRAVVGAQWDGLVDWDGGIGALGPEVVYGEFGQPSLAVEHAVRLYDELLQERRRTWTADRFDRWIDEARDRDLACFCPPEQPCHAEVLLALVAAPSAQRRRRACCDCEHAPVTEPSLELRGLCQRCFMRNRIAGTLSQWPPRWSGDEATIADLRDEVLEQAETIRDLRRQLRESARALAVAHGEIERLTWVAPVVPDSVRTRVRGRRAETP